jgi:type I restriction-modification system DNA methylase subunit
VIETEEDIDYEIEHTISNKEAMYDMIHSIHNFIRNNGGGYGMNALKLFSLFYGLCKIELKANENEKKKIKLKTETYKELGLSDKCLFSNIRNTINEKKEKGFQYIKKEVLKELYTNKITKEMLYYPINDLNIDFVFSLINMIDKLCQMEVELNFQLAGKIYEYFIGRDQSAIQELGAYFTDRPITNYIYEDLLKPELDENGNVPTMIDMFGGSGGFTIGYLNYLNTHNDIDWSKQLNSVYHFDMNIDVVRYAMLEFYCITGQFPSKDNMASTNSFTSEFNKKKFKYICTNPPYGGDKIEKTEEIIISEMIKKEIQEYFKQKYKIKTMKQISKFEITDKSELNKRKQYDYVYDKIKEFEKEKEKKTVNLDNSANRFKEYAKDNEINGSKCKDKEAVSFLMMMDMLDVGGTAVGVLKEGLFFDSKYKHLREHLIENFNVSKVVSIDASQFENTSTKTSIIMFSNTGKTEKINFYELVIDKDLKTTIEEDDNGVYVMKTIEGRINSVSDKFLTSATYEDIVKNEYTLNHKKYNKVELKPGDGYKMVKLGDIVDIVNGFAFKKNDFIKNGTKVVKIKNVKNGVIELNSIDSFVEYNKTYSKYLLINNDIVLSLTGKNGNSCSIGKYNNTTNDKVLLNQRLCILRNVKINSTYLISLFNNILIDYINKTTQDGSIQCNISSKDIENLQLPIPEDKQKMIDWVKKIDKPYNKIQECKNKIKELEAQVQTDIQKILDENETEEVALGELCEINNKLIKRYNTNYGKSSGKYNFHTGTSNVKYYCDTYNINKYTIIINKTNGSGKCNINLDKFISCAKQTYILQHKIETVTIFIYYILTKKINELEKGYIGACHKNLSYDFLNSFKITLPKDRKLLDTLNPLFEEIDKYNDELPKQEEKYNKYLQQLRQEAIKE